MLKTKISYLKTKPNYKTKTLQSFCKYQQNRHTSAFLSNNILQKGKVNIREELDQSFTDAKIEEIKKKYGIPSRNAHNHQRYHSVLEFSANNQNNRGKLRSALRQRALSNFSINCNQKSIGKNQIQGKDRYQGYSRITADKQNVYLIKIQSKNKDSVRINTEENYNNTFSREQIKKSNQNSVNEYEILKQPKQQPIQNKKVEQPSRLKYNSRFENVGSSNYNPRIQNIENINVRIKSALQNFEKFQKRDISINLNVQNPNKFAHKTHTSAFIGNPVNSNDLIETRILQKNPYHRKTFSIFGNSKNQIQPQTRVRTQGDLNNALKINYDSYQLVQKKIDQDSKKLYQSVVEKEQNLFSRMKTLYKKSMEFEKVEKQEVKQRHIRPMSHHEIQQTQNQPLLCSSTTPPKSYNLQEIRNKYNKSSYHSAYKEKSNQGDKSEQKRMTTVRKSKSPQKKHFDLIYVKEDKSQSYGDEIQDFDKNNDQVNQLDCSRLQEIIKLTKSGIQMRKKTKQAFEQQTQNKVKNSLSNDIYSLLKSQIQIDENLRKAKYWFKYQPQNQKWIQLHQQFVQTIKTFQASNGSNQTKDIASKIKKLTIIPIEAHFVNFKILDEEIDPFFSLRVCQYTFKDLVQAYLQAQANWDKIVAFGIIRKMIDSRWVEQIDIERKGYVSLADLTQFMNLKSQTFYKNRDTALIFNRLSLNQKSSSNISNSGKYRGFDSRMQAEYRNCSFSQGVSDKRITCNTLRQIQTSIMRKI